MVTGDLIRAAMRKITTYASGENPTANELADGLSALQLMLRSWASRNLLVMATTAESVTLPASTLTLSWGADGDIDTTRPHRLVSGEVYEDSLAYPLELLSEGKYNRITDKSITERPTCMVYRPTYPLASLVLYPIPDKEYIAIITSFKPFTETSSFDNLDSTILLPPNYEEAVVYNLAIRLASEYGVAIPTEIAVLASGLLNNIMNLNVVNQLEAVCISVPGDTDQGARYNINSDSYGGL